MSLLLTTTQVARLLQVHPKHVYRLLKRGLPGRRVGGEWRFDRDEVLAWTREGAGEPVASASPDETGSATRIGARKPVASPRTPPPLLAANGDLAVEALLALLAGTGPPFVGLVASDGGSGIELLERREVLAAGYHGPDPLTTVGAESTMEAHLVRREVGLAARKPHHLPSLCDLSDVRLASRPVSAGVRRHLDRALTKAGLDPAITHFRARLLASHRDVVLAVARGEADVGLTTRAWARRLGLAFAPFVQEDYGIVVFAAHIEEPSLSKLLDVAASQRFRKAIGRLGGYDASRSGEMRFVGHGTS